MAQNETGPSLGRSIGRFPRCGSRMELIKISRYRISGYATVRSFTCLTRVSRAMILLDRRRTYLYRINFSSASKNDINVQQGEWTFPDGSLSAAYR
jgi:hypothetical protein